VTEDWSNDAENSALPSQEYITLRGKQIFEQYFTILQLYYIFY